MIGVNRNFVYEMELGQHTNTIYALHKVYLFFGYLPKVLKIDETTLPGILFTHRIRYGYTYQKVAEKIGLDKSTLSRFEKGGKIKKDTFQVITKFLNVNAIN